MANPSSSSIDVIQQISDDASLLHRFCHGGDSESVRLGGIDTPTVHSFLSQWVQFLHSVAVAGETVAPELESGNYNTQSGASAADSSWLRTASYYPVFAGRIYAVDFHGLTSTSGEAPDRVDIHFYDEEKTWLSCEVNRLFAVAPSSARYIRLSFKFSSSVTAGSSPKAVVKDVVGGTRSAGGSNGKRVVELNWHKGYIGSSSTMVDVGSPGTSGYLRYALAFVSKGDLVWLKAGQSANQSVIACIDATGAVSHKVVQGSPRDNWLDHMWIADQDTCVILSNNVSWKASPECIIYPNFLYNSDTFNDAAFNKPGAINTGDGHCDSDVSEINYSNEGYIYASSEMVCLKKGQHISSVSAAYSSTYAIACYDSANEIDSSGSILGASTTDMSFFGLRCTEDFCFVRICGRIRENDTAGVAKFASYKVFNQTELSGKSLAMIGDSYVHQNNITSYPRAAYNLGMDYTSYGISGNTISAYQENGMVNRYTEMADGFDYVGLVGGRNDYNNSVTIGSLDSTDTSTFCGALNVLCEGLIKKYIGAKLFAVTSWNVNAGQNAYNDAFVAVVSGRWNIPVLQTYKGANVYVKVAEFREAYCIADNDVSHLNILGHMNIMAPTIEAFIKTL